MVDRSLPTEAGTPRQRFWLEHLEACEAQGTSLKAYALAHGLSASALYTAKSALKRRRSRVGRSDPVSMPKLVPVRVARPASMFRVLLPNGVVVEVPEHAVSFR